MNALQAIRTKNGLTYEKLGSLAGYQRPVTWKHCHSQVIPAEAAIRYARALDIPLADLRPDLFSSTAPSTGAVVALPEARP